MNKELNTNNSKKIIIGISILFCTVILIIGGSIAYFTQSGIGDVDNIVTTDINNTIEYNDDYNENNIYNRQGLIPANLENVLTAYNREENDKCLDSLGYSACSIYRFSVTNNSNVSQELMMTLNPTANSYTNLKFIMFEIKEDNKVQIMETTDLIKEKYDPINLVSSYILNPNNTKTYELVFFIEAKDYDQTLEDSGKQFGAGIRIDSITTGKYITKQYGSACWNVEEITEGDNAGTYKLVTFNGIDNNGTLETNENYGKTDESCSGYVEQDENGFYSVTIPSTVGGKQISTIGNGLFFAADIQNGTLNNYNKIKSITIDEGITTIEDGCFDNSCTVETMPFGYVGFNLGPNGMEFLFDDGVNIKLPSTLTKIGDFGFYAILLKNIELPQNLKTIGQETFRSTFIFSSDEQNPLIIPASVEYIGPFAFDSSTNLTKVIFEDSVNNPSQLKTIETGAFDRCNLTYSEEEPLILPNGITIIGFDAFYANPNLLGIRFEGTLTAGNTDWYDSKVTKLNPHLNN